MHICIVHNEYSRPSGEEAVVNSVWRLLENNGHRVSSFIRRSTHVEAMRLGNIRAFFSGIYSLSSKVAFRRMLLKSRPDVVHVHNVFPLISPSVLGQCRKEGVPLVMTVHNYRLVCPNGLHMVRGQVCEKCLGGREYWCVLRRCEGCFSKSLGYAVRNAVARKAGLFRRNVTMYAALTAFQRDRLIANGFPADRIAVLPNMVDGDTESTPATPGGYVAYAGRVSPEKGVTTLIKSAAQLSDIWFKAAGRYDGMPELVEQAPSNFSFLDHLEGTRLAEFYRQARIVVLPTQCFEGFPTSIVEAMLHGKPVICSRIGGLPQIVEDGVTGLLFIPGDSVDLASKIRQLWESPIRCQQMGQAGRAKAVREFSRERYYGRLMHLYEKAIELGPGGPS